VSEAQEVATHKERGQLGAPAN